MAEGSPQGEPIGHALVAAGRAALVATNGDIAFSKGYGLANMEWDIPNRPDTKFRLGSITC